MKHIIGLLALLLPILSAAQTAAKTTFTVGSILPDLVLPNAYNYQHKEIALSDFKDKLVILDFWSTTCGACLSAMPRGQKLQEKIGDKVQIILVNSSQNDNIEKVQKTFSRMEEVSGITMNLPFVLKDTLLKGIFPHFYIPHYVWILNNEVKAITDEEEVNEENILAYLNSEERQLETKRDDLIYDPSLPLLAEKNGGTSDKFLYRSILTGYKPHLGAGSGTQREEGKVVKYYQINSHILNLFRSAFPEISELPKTRYVFEVENIEQFKSYKDPKKNRAIQYCYELIIPATDYERINEYIKDDLKKFFNIDVHKDVRSINCLVLTATPDINRLYTNGDSTFNLINEDYVRKVFKNQSLSSLSNFLEYILNTPVVNETNITKNIDLEFPTDFYDYDLPGVSSFLEKHGLIIKSQKRELEVAVFTNIQNREKSQN